VTGLVENAEHTDGYTVTDNTVSDEEKPSEDPHRKRSYTYRHGLQINLEAHPPIAGTAESALGRRLSRQQLGLWTDRLTATDSLSAATSVPDNTRYMLCANAIRHGLGNC
jgi:hypothetical protein